MRTKGNLLPCYSGQLTFTAHIIQSMHPLPLPNNRTKSESWHRWLVGLPALLLLVSASRAADYSFADDFLISSNESNTSTNTWQYFHGIDLANRDGNYTRLATFDVNHMNQGFPAWAPAPNALPSVGKITRSSPFAGVQPQEGHLHPAPSDPAAVAFHAPSDGFYDISGYVRAANSGGGNGIRWYLDHGTSAGNLGSGTLGRARGESFEFRAVPLKAGEKLFLIIDANGNHLFDSTAVGFYVSRTTLNLELAFRPTVTVLGIPGKMYRVEYADAIPSPFTWITMTNVVLSGPSHVVVDLTPISPAKRFYRAVELP